MFEYTIGIMRDAGRPRRYLRMKSDAPIAVTDAVVSFTKKQEDKTAVYECIIGDMIRETEEGGLFYRWYALESVLIETDHTPPVAAELASMAPAASIAFVTLAEGGQIDDTTATENAGQFAEWAYPVDYDVGAIRRDGEEGGLYRCIQAHTSAEDWRPGATPALWKAVGDPGEEWPEWAQPIGAHDAYNSGDKVSHNGKHWTSDISANVWEPGVYGWTEAVDLESMTIAEVKTYAAEREIDLAGKTKKADIIAAIRAAE